MAVRSSRCVEAARSSRWVEAANKRAGAVVSRGLESGSREAAAAGSGNKAGSGISGRAVVSRLAEYGHSRMTAKKLFVDFHFWACYHLESLSFPA